MNALIINGNDVESITYATIDDLPKGIIKGDIVSIIEKSNNRTLDKKDGTIVWVLNEKLCEKY